MSNNDYKIGYKRPPKHTQFKKGQSGNPKGRSKRSDDKNLWGILEDVLKQGVSVKQGASTKVMQIAEAAIQALVAQGLKGNVPALRLLLQYQEKACPVEHSIAPPVMIIKPPDGPAPPEPPIYGE
jgi:hypothetical protein